MVKFITKFDDEVTTELNKATLKKGKIFYVIFSIAMVLLALILLIGALTDEVKDVGDIIFAVLYLLFGIFFYPIVKGLTNVIQKKVNKSMPLLSSNTVETYIFDQDKIIIETENKDLYSSRVEAKYEYIFKVMESKDTYFLYISKMQSHVVKKKYLTEGTLEELNGYISEHFKNITANRNGITYNK